jgi:hypothetical protein
MRFHAIAITTFGLLAGTYATGDCGCVAGFDQINLPKMNVTSFFAQAYPNGSSV